MVLAFWGYRAYGPHLCAAVLDYVPTYCWLCPMQYTMPFTTHQVISNSIWLAMAASFQYNSQNGGGGCLGAPSGLAHGCSCPARGAFLVARRDGVASVPAGCLASGRKGAA